MRFPDRYQNPANHNLNQIAKKANQTDKIDKDYYKSEANNWHKFAEEVKDKFL